MEYSYFLFSKVRGKNRFPQPEYAHKILEEDSDLFSLYTCHLTYNDRSSDLSFYPKSNVHAASRGFEIMIGN